MSKKDYIKLAQALKDSKPKMFNSYDSAYHNQLIRWSATVENINYMLAQDNPSFDRNKFLAACGYND